MKSKSSGAGAATAGYSSKLTAQIMRGKLFRMYSDIRITNAQAGVATRMRVSRGLWACKSGKNCPRWGRFSLSTPQVRQAPRCAPGLRKLTGPTQKRTGCVYGFGKLACSRTKHIGVAFEYDVTHLRKPVEKCKQACRWNIERCAQFSQGHPACLIGEHLDHSQYHHARDRAW